MTGVTVRRCVMLGVVVVVAVVLMSAIPVDAQTTSRSATNLRVKVFAYGSATMTQPDDITYLGGDIFVAWQNGVGPAGQPAPGGGTTSEVVQYGSDGTTINQWALTGHVDGLTAFPEHGDVIATANEDGNSSLYTIDPSASSGSQVVHYSYNLNPLPSGGGTDAISIVDGQILVSASAPTVSNGPAVYRVTLSGTTAVVQPVFFDNSTAVVANTNEPNRGEPVTLALTDPDSNEVVPASSSRFAGDFVLDSQGDEEQLYVKDVTGATPQLSVLQLSQAVDDTAWITSTGGVLYSTDGVDNEVFAVTGNFPVGTILTSVTPGDANTPVNAPNYLGYLNLRTGQISPAVTTIQSKGLLYVP